MALPLLFVALPSLADEMPQRRKKLVAIFPLKRFDHPCSHLFASGHESAPFARNVHRWLEEELSRQEALVVVPPSQLWSRITGRNDYREKVVLGRERYMLGKEFYRDLRQADAEPQLLRSVELLDTIYYDVVEPEALAEIQLLLGVTLVEEGRVAQAHLAFKRSLLLAPASRFPAGYYPQPVEQALTVACEDLQQSLEREVPLGSVDRTVRFLSDLKIDVLFFPLLVSGEDGVELILVAYDSRSRSTVLREVFPREEEETTRERVSRAVSRFSACTPYENVPRKVEEKHRFLLAAKYENLLYLVQPVRSPLLAMGFSFEAGHFFMKSFALVGKLQVFSSLKDRFDDLLSGFTSARLILGPAFSISGEWWRLYVVPGAEFHYMGSFDVSRDPDCKFYLSGSPGRNQTCPPSSIMHFPVDFVVGVNVFLGSQFFFADQLFLDLGASVSTYFAPFDRSFDINFPLALELGGGVVF
ncbi:MAG: hypothetical protein FJ109_07575 [Deltaproteobacteria bacterium]|nr:hypothetical protein [Deltaproteobacteria bacterium]